MLNWTELDAASESDTWLILLFFLLLSLQRQCTNLIRYDFIRVLKPPGGGSSDIFGTTEAAGSNSNGSNKKQFSSQFSLGNDEDAVTVEPQRKSSVDSIDGASTTSSQTSTTNGSPNTSEPNTPRSGTPHQKLAF